MEASLAEVRPLEAGVTEVVLRTRAFTTGRFEAPLPPIELERAGEFWGSVELDAVVVTVESVLDPFRLEPRPLSAPQSLPEGERHAGALAVGRDRSSDRAGGGIDGVASAPSLARRRSVHRRGSGRIVSGRLGWDCRIDDRLSGAEQCAEIGRQGAAGRGLGRTSTASARRARPRRSCPAVWPRPGAPASTVERVRTLLRECDAAPIRRRRPGPRPPGRIPPAGAVDLVGVGPDGGGAMRFEDPLLLALLVVIPLYVWLLSRWESLPRPRYLLPELAARPRSRRGRLFSDPPLAVAPAGRRGGLAGRRHRPPGKRPRWRRSARRRGSTSCW